MDTKDGMLKLPSLRLTGVETLNDLRFHGSFWVEYFIILASEFSW